MNPIDFDDPLTFPNLTFVLSEVSQLNMTEYKHACIITLLLSIIIT